MTAPRPGDPLDVGVGGTPPPPAATPGPVEPAPPTAPRRERHTGRTIGRGLALGLLLFATVVLVLFVVFNTQTVDISLVFGNVDAPLVVALLIAAVLGATIGWLTSLVLRARRRSRG